MSGLTLVAVLQPNELVAVDAVEGKNNHHHEVGNQETDIERVPAVLAAERPVRVVRLPVVRQCVLVGEEQRESVNGMCQGCGSQRMSARSILRDRDYLSDEPGHH